LNTNMKKWKMFDYIAYLVNPQAPFHDRP